MKSMLSWCSGKAWSEEESDHVTVEPRSLFLLIREGGSMQLGLKVDLENLYLAFRPDDAEQLTKRFINFAFIV